MYVILKLMNHMFITKAELKHINVKQAFDDYKINIIPAQLLRIAREFLLLGYIKVKIV